VFNLEGKTIVVSGAASGIGRSVARELAATGARPVLVDIDEAGLAATAAEGPALQASPRYRCDVSDPESVVQMFRSIQSDVGPVHGAVASAGVRNVAKTLEVSVEDWRRVIDINLSGVFYFSREAARACVREGGGSIVSIASVAAFGGLPERVNYCSAKAGVMNMTKVMAIELASQGVRVNAVAPGATQTPLADGNPEERRRKLVSRTPMGRYGEPREISNVVLFLLSDLASFVTGTTIAVDGGWSAGLM